MTITSICLLGFGEVGSVLARSLEAPGISLSATDVKFVDPQSKASHNAAAAPRMKALASADEAVSGADLIVSAVTAEQDLAAAQSVVKSIKKNAWFLDLNSVSPNTKREVAELIESAGGRYVEAAVMSPIHPKGIASPILLGGPHAEEVLPLLRNIGFAGASVCDSTIGKAAATKMCRSVMIKGLESLLTESLLTARFYGVEQEVITSLNNLMPGVDWQQHSAYMISRSLEHGVRRAEEMREAAKTVKEAGLKPRMSSACAETQEWTAGVGNNSPQTPLETLLTLPLERMLDQMRKGLVKPS